MSIIVDVDLRSKLGDTRDQRQRPTCLAFALSAAHEASRVSNDYLSTEFLFFSGAQRSHRDPSRGLTRTAVEEALREDGQPCEAAWPYRVEPPAAANWKAPENCEPLHRATVTFTSGTLTEVGQTLRIGVPVVLVVSLTTAMYVPDANGIVRSRQSDVTTTSRHALLAVGLGHDNDGEYILVRNSWGARWGLLGHAWCHGSCFVGRLHWTGTIS